MSSDNRDALHIPIEIKTSDSEEIQALINDLAAAESDIRSIRPRRGRGTGDTSSRSAFASPEEEGTGIFGGMTGEATPTAIRDRTSKSPFQRENEFSKLKDRVDQQEQRISTSFQQKAQQGIGLATQGIGYAQALGGATAGAGSIMARIQGIAGKAFIPISVIMKVMEIASTVLNEALKPGGPLDRRFKRIIGDEIAATADLEFKEQVNQGFKVIRISTQPGLSGDAGVTSNLQKRTTIYDLGISRSMAGLQG